MSKLIVLNLVKIVQSKLEAYVHCMGTLGGLYHKHSGESIFTNNFVFIRASMK